MLEIKEYVHDIREIADIPYNWIKLHNKTVMISGATGMIGKFLVDLLMYRNESDNLNCTVVALGRNAKKAESRFPEWLNDEHFIFVEQDITKPIDYEGHVDYIIHAASNTHPLAYSSDPIGTITANVDGTRNLLDLAQKNENSRFVFLSSVEIYGQNRGDVELFREDYCGYINSNTLRAGYPESKRVGEALCQAYKKQYGVDVVIPRLSRVYGPTMLLNDSKALSQFILKGVNNEDVILKSEGLQYFSYIYVADCVSAIIKIMLDGENGEAYNVGDENSNIHLKDLANIIANYNNKQVIFELPSEAERAGYSTATTALLDTTKLKELGFNAKTNINEGLNKTITIIKQFI